MMVSIVEMVVEAVLIVEEIEEAAKEVVSVEMTTVVSDYLFRKRRIQQQQKIEVPVYQLQQWFGPHWFEFRSECDPLARKM